MGADRPEPADPPRGSPLDDLRQRLARLPSTHPSGTGYDRAFTAPSGLSGAWRGDGPADGPAAGRDAERGAAGGGADRGERAAAGTADPDPADGSVPGAGSAPVVRGRADKPAGPDLAALQRLDRLARMLWPDGRAGADRALRRVPEIRGSPGSGRRTGREPYQPWFCSGDPYQPWFTQDPDDRCC